MNMNMKITRGLVRGHQRSLPEVSCLSKGLKLQKFFTWQITKHCSAQFQNA